MIALAAHTNSAYNILNLWLLMPIKITGEYHTLLLQTPHSATTDGLSRDFFKARD